ncbi:MAG TPA: response regulator [Spirochaetales bacterium]|nr:response regulator [Spirochaetales bacterium]
MAKSAKRVRIFSALEVANLCGVVNQTAINWIRNGHLKAFTTPGGQYRVYAEDLSEFLEGRGMRIPDEVRAEATLEDASLDWDTILVVDDDKALVDVIVRTFQKDAPSFNILTAYDGFEAGSAIVEKKPGFIILDIGLPGVDGVKICRQVKTEPTYGKPFVIVITGLDEEGLSARIMTAGADALLPKPLDLDSLLAIIQDLAGKVRDTYGS